MLSNFASIYGIKLFNCVNKYRVNTSVSQIFSTKKFNSTICFNPSRYMSTTGINLQKILEKNDNIVRSDQDNRVYRGVILGNKIKCLLISDDKTDRSAASVDVNAGYLLDPKEFPGLAHFCEHMLFMGSKKYPVENIFQKFIEDHAGSTNAYTAGENTNYHFEIAPEKLKEALDIFAQFFISPSFHADSTFREINAVDSENQKNLQSDAWRIDQLEKSTCDPNHPYSKFGTGNLNTLKTDPEKLGLPSVREELLKYHTKNYSANLMTMCLLGKEDLDTLQNYAIEMFSDIPNKDLPKVTFDPDPFGKDTIQTIKYVVPVKDIRQLGINWVIPDYREFYESSPYQYISHLVGHEGDGSLLSELKRKGWCNHLYAGSRREARGFQFFSINLDLTEEGAENIQNVTKLVFQYLKMLKNEKPIEWVFDEMNNLGKISFKFKDKERPINYVSSLTSDLHVFKMDDILSANYYLKKFDPEGIQKLFDYLTPERMRVTVVSKKYEKIADQKEKWYGTDYKMEKIPQEQIEELKSVELNSVFHIPPKNTFVPSNLDVIDHVVKNPVPKAVRSSQLTRLWYKEDTKFKLPKAVIRTEIRNPIVYFNTRNSNMANLFVDLLTDSLSQILYPAELADMRYNISPSNYGLNITVSGFSDKIDVLLKTIYERVASFKVDKQRFDILKEAYQRNLINFEADQPFKHAVYYMTQLLSEKGWTKKQLLESLNTFSCDDVQEFIPQILTQGVFIESVMFGNLTQERAENFATTIEEQLKSTSLTKVDNLTPLEKIHHNNFRQVQIPDGSSYVFINNNTVHKTSAVEIYFQFGVQNTHNNALVELFCQVINEPCFNVLRTQEQLGYIVASGSRNFGGAQGVRIIVQSDRSPLELDDRIENFIRLTNDSLKNMTDEEFKTHVDALKLIKLEEPKRMSKQCDIFWNEITSHQYNFEREKIEVDELMKLTKEDLIVFYDTYIKENASKRKKLAVYICPPEMNDQLTQDKLKGDLITDLNDWRASLGLYPLIKPYSKIDQ